MTENKETQSVDELIKNFDLYKNSEDRRENCSCITLWISNDYKAKYDQIQLESKRRFAKLLQTLVKYSIDKITSP